MKYIRILLFIASIFLISFAIAGCPGHDDQAIKNPAPIEQNTGAWTPKIQQRANVKSHIIWATICAPGTKLIVNEDGTLACDTPIIWPPSLGDPHIKWNAMVVVACQNPDNTLTVPNTNNDNGQLSCPSS